MYLMHNSLSVIFCNASLIFNTWFLSDKSIIVSGSSTIPSSRLYRLCFDNFLANAVIYKYSLPDDGMCEIITVKAIR